MLGIPPSFEPNTPCEPQWFPRCISDSIESSADLLERLEEDRKRRLRSIANVSARTPIGLGGVKIVDLELDTRPNQRVVIIMIIQSIDIIHHQQNLRLSYIHHTQQMKDIFQHLQV